MQIGPFNVRVRSDLPGLVAPLLLQYANHSLLDDAEFCDCTLDVLAPSLLRRHWRPQVQVRYDGHWLFQPLPQDQAFALLEWTINWWVANHAHQYLLLHSAVVARPDGRAVVLPAPPGSGKSTLCAGLVQRGWRLLSDEMAMISLDDGLLYGMARPVSLKNESLEVIRRFEPAAVLGRPVRDTAKGTIAHLRPSPDDVAGMAQPARAAWVVFPRYVADGPATLSRRPKADAMMWLGRNAFNYALLGAEGFEALVRLVNDCEHYDFSYGRLEDAVRVFGDLAGGEPS